MTVVRSLLIGLPIAAAALSSSPANAGVGCLGPGGASCYSILDWTMNQTPQLSDLYNTVKNRINTAGCSYGSSDTGLYSFYGHMRETDTNNIVPVGANNITCETCAEDSTISEHTDSYDGVCAPQHNTGWSFASQFCGFALGLTLWEAAYYMINCTKGTKSACSTNYGCLQ